MKKLLVIIFSLLILGQVLSAPTNTISLTTPTDNTVVSASDETSRYNEISTKFGAHDHQDFTLTTSNTFTVGDNAVGNKDIAVNTDQANNPTIRYNTTTDIWTISDDGSTFSTHSLATGTVRILDTQTITGDKTFSGATIFSGITTFSGTIAGSLPVVFEGATADDFETTFAITDPTVDRTVTFPDADVTLADITLNSTHRADNTQAHSDYLLNNADDTTTGIITAEGLTLVGAAPSPPTANTIYKDNIIKGWIQFNGTGTIEINDSFNVSGITDNNVGDYTVTWDTDFANSNYTVSVVGKASSGGAGASNIVAVTSEANNPAAGSVRIWSENVAGTPVDNEQMHVIAIGDQ